MDIQNCIFIIACLTTFIILFLAPSLVVVIDPNNFTAKVFGSVTFICFTNVSGDKSFTWEHDGLLISSSNSTSQQDFLIIGLVQPKHQGQYKCTVKLSYSNLSSDAFASLNLNGNHIAIHIL